MDNPTRPVASDDGSVEVHDSVLAGLSFAGDDVVIRLSPAFVHRSPGRAGVDPGTVWLQTIDLVISEAVVDRSPSGWPVVLWDGSISVDGARWDNVIPLPLALAGAVAFEAVTIPGESLSVRGNRVEVVLQGSPRYLEPFP